MSNWCKCNLMFNGGDMSPRMWKCPDHGIRSFIAIDNIIKNHADQLGLKEKNVRQKAWEFLKKKEAEPGIYFCEDHFAGDLIEHLNE